MPFKGFEEINISLKSPAYTPEAKDLLNVQDNLSHLIKSHLYGLYTFSYTVLVKVRKLQS